MVRPQVDARGVGTVEGTGTWAHLLCRGQAYRLELHARHSLESGHEVVRVPLLGRRGDEARKGRLWGLRRKTWEVKWLLSLLTFCIGDRRSDLTFPSLVLVGSKQSRGARTQSWRGSPRELGPCWCWCLCWCLFEAVSLICQFPPVLETQGRHLPLGE